MYRLDRLTDSSTNQLTRQRWCVPSGQRYKTGAKVIIVTLLLKVCMTSLRRHCAAVAVGACSCHCYNAGASPADSALNSQHLDTWRDESSLLGLSSCCQVMTAAAKVYEHRGKSHVRHRDLTLLINDALYTLQVRPKGVGRGMAKLKLNASTNDHGSYHRAATSVVERETRNHVMCSAHNTAPKHACSLSG